MSLPTIDASQLHTAAGRLALLQSLTQHGFVKLVNHGISDENVEQLFEWNKKFFTIPFHEKVKIAHQAGPDPQRGWSAVGAENSSTLYKKGVLGEEVPNDLRDAREHFDQGPEKDPQFPNRWPEDNVLPGFQDFMKLMFTKFESVNSSILSALETGLELPEGSFTSRCTASKNASELRMNHYPAIDIKEINGGKVSRIWPHFDLGVITLLFQDTIGGLEYENREKPGTFNRIPAGKRSELIVNVSETLQRWTNNQLRAGLHRVSLPEKLEGEQDGVVPERFSIAFFCKADRQANVGVLDQFVQEGKETAYKDITALEYQQQRLLSAY